MGDTQPPLEYLGTCSQNALEAYLLSRLTRLAEIRQEIHALLNEWVQLQGDERIARSVLGCRRTDAIDGLSVVSARLLPPPHDFDLSPLFASGATENWSTHSDHNVCRRDSSRGPRTHRLRASRSESATLDVQAAAHSKLRTRTTLIEIPRTAVLSARTRYSPRPNRILTVLSNPYHRHAT